MFSGIVESVMPILRRQDLDKATRIQVKKPIEFDDLKIGDSIACNGICLTVEQFDSATMTFTLAAETLRVLEMNPEHLVGRPVNLERSLRFGDRIHGHLVTGHVDSLGQVTKAQQDGDNFFLNVQTRPELAPYIWEKGSITLHGVSLTVNKVVGGEVEVCLIPETVKRTNLGLLKVGDRINVEPDYFAKALRHQLEVGGLWNSIASKNS